MKRGKRAIAKFLLVWVLCIGGLSVVQQEAEAKVSISLVDSFWKIVQTVIDKGCEFWQSDRPKSTVPRSDLCSDENFKQHVKSMLRALIVAWDIRDANTGRISYVDSEGHPIAMSTDWWLFLQVEKFCDELETGT